MIYKLTHTRVYRSYLGGENLDKLEGKEPHITRFPEDWIASVTTAFNPDREMVNEGMSQTEEGDFLKDIIFSDKINMIGNREGMSFLFKLLDSAERLVIQAHPTVEFAKKYFGSQYGKTECWYILNDGGSVYIGFKEGVTKEYWKHLFETQDIPKMLDCLHKFSVKRGDFIFVEGGVPHAIGENCFLAELQEPTDLMVIPEKVTPSGVVLSEQKIHGGIGYEKMFDCFNYNGYDAETTKREYFKKPHIINNNELVIVDKTVTDKFRFVEINVDGEYEFFSDSYCVCVVISGNAEIGGYSLGLGDRIFVSDDEKGFFVKGTGKILVVQP